MSLGSLWPLVCMANHTIVLIIASQIAPSKDIHNITCSHTQKRTHLYSLTVSSLAVNPPQIYFVWGREDPPLKSNTHFGLMLDTPEPSIMKMQTHTHTLHAQLHTQDNGCIIHPPKLGTPVVCSHTINSNEFISNLPSAENMKHLIIPQNKNS